MFTFAYINNTPVIYGHTFEGVSRVYGSVYNKEKDLWFIPVYPPSLEFVLFDLTQLERLDILPTELFDFKNRHNRETIAGQVDQFDWPYSSYEHQKEGLIELIYNYRYGLRFDMGCGKTKIVVDQIHMLKNRTLVVCPKVGLENWKNEINMFAPQLTCQVLRSTSGTKALAKTLDSAIHSDVIICTYGLAATIGIPKIKEQAIKHLKIMAVAPTPTLTTELKKINDAKVQIQWIQDWRKGRNIKDIRLELADMNLGPQWIQDLPYTQIVADESHRIKTNASLQTQACLKLADKACRRILLTGTMSHGNVLDVFPQLKFLTKASFNMNYTQFKRHFTVGNPANPNIVIGYKHLDHVNRVVNRYTIERNLESCIDMPERTFIRVDYRLSVEQKNSYNTLIETGELDLPDDTSITLANNAVRINKLLQICSGFLYVNNADQYCDECPYDQVRFCVENNVTPGTGLCTRKDVDEVAPRSIYNFHHNPKLEALKEYLIDALPSGKCIIWGVFTAELDMIEELLKKQGYGYVRVDGGTKDTSSLVDKFNNDPHIDVYLAHISTGIMITLNAAKYSIYYSRDYSIEHRQQSLYRNFRINQDKKTIVCDLCGTGTLENQQLTALKNKTNIAELMTKRIDCAICNKYENCLKEQIKPWDADCVLSSKVTRTITKAQLLK